MKVKNAVEPVSNFGTLGGVVYRGTTPLLLTCFHCIYTKGMKWDTKIPANNSRVSFYTDDNSLFEGNIVNTYRDEFVDAALLSVDSQHKIDSELYPFGKIKSLLGPADMIGDFTPLKKYGAVTGKRLGVFVGVRPEYGAYYPGDHGAIHNLQSLIKVRNQGEITFCEKGDSGAFVVSGNNELVGMIVMKDAEFTYVMQAAALELKLNIKFIC
jgi:hypothetical protein